MSRPILYGNTAEPLGANKTPDMPPDHTHRWTIFVRDPNGQDLSRFIKKVIFKLHDTYPNPSRSIEAPPFEVTETGWGEFEITIRIFFIPEAAEKNIQLYHHLKLHPYVPGTVPGGIPGMPTADGTVGYPGVVTQPVESYIYDELVFNEPTEPLFEILTERPGALLAAKKTLESPYSQQTENEELDRLTHALAKVYHQVQKIREQITVLEREKNALVAGDAGAIVAAGMSGAVAGGGNTNSGANSANTSTAASPAIR